MRVIRWALRIAATAALAVAVGVAVNQILNGGTFTLRWAVAAFVLSLVSEGVNQWLARRDARQAPAGQGGPGQRAVYLRQLRSHVQRLETIGITTRGVYVPELRQVYVDVSLKPQTPQDAASAAYVGHAGSTTGHRRSLRDFLDDDTGGVFAIIGGPGTGKTTLMQATALEHCRRWRGLRRRRLPVLLYLRDHAAAILADPASGLPEVCAAAPWVSGRTPASWLARQLDRRRCLVMLDGLDEVADQAQRETVVTWVRRQLDRYPGNVYLLTSRPQGYTANPLPRAEVLQVRRFTGEQISRFLYGWYYATLCRETGTKGARVRLDAHEAAEDLLAKLRSRPGLYDLAANPLLLTMIANVHKYRPALPRSRAALYAEMCDVLVHLRQDAKGLPDPTGLTGPQKDHLMRVLALTMMDGRLRDIPTGQAADAIAGELAGTSTTLSPATFLQEVRRSGLLVEREHGRYGFAHLTLQEYLAAARLGSLPEATGRLAANVDDPWWRETTLLWSATADATPIVSACLASGTVRALSLAFDCADEARTIAPAVRAELDALLTEEPADQARKRLVTAVRAARSLREVIWLNESTTVCAHPVDAELWALFARADQATGRCTPIDLPTTGTAAHGAGTSGFGAVLGMWAGDAERFLTWLNGHFDDGTAYRLPTPQELDDPAMGLVADLTRHPAWSAEADQKPKIHRPSTGTWPHPRIELNFQNHLREDRRTTAHYLYSSIEPTPRFRRNDRILTRVMETQGRDNSPIAVRIRALTLAFGLLLDETGASDFPADALAAELGKEFGISMPFTMANAISTAMLHALSLDEKIDGTGNVALERKLERLDDADLLAGNLADELLRIAAARLDHALENASAALRREPWPHADLRPSSPYFKPLAPRIVAEIYAMFPTKPETTELMFAVMMALEGREDARLSPPTTNLPLTRGTNTVACYYGLLYDWSRQVGKGKPGDLLTDFDQFFDAALSVIEPAGIADWSEATDLLIKIRSQVPLRTQEIDHVHQLLRQILDRTAPPSDRLLASIRIELLAEIKNREDSIAQQLMTVFYAVTALQKRISGLDVPDEVLILVRA
ncbi:NACHT domain-containing protein [Spirillospora sp. NPDC046719]